MVFVEKRTKKKKGLFREISQRKYLSPAEKFTPENWDKSNSCDAYFSLLLLKKKKSKCFPVKKKKKIASNSNGTSVLCNRPRSVTGRIYLSPFTIYIYVYHLHLPFTQAINIYHLSAHSMHRMKTIYRSHLK